MDKKAKPPAMQFYVKDWLSDTGKLTLGAKGAWIQICCVLHLADTRGEDTQTGAAWARICGCSTGIMDRVLQELRDSGASRVTFGSNEVTVVCRRMERERNDKETHALRQARYRRKRKVTKK